MYFNRHLLVSAVLVLALAGCSTPKQREAKYIKRGTELFNQGQFEKARLEFRNAARITPADAEVRYRLGLVDEAQGDLHSAFVNFMHSVEQDAHYRPGLLKVAHYFLEAEQDEDAERRLSVVLADTPNDPEAHALRAASFLRQGKIDDAQKEAQFALAREPSNVTATTVLTNLYLTQDNKAAAIATLENGITLNKNDLSLLQLKIGTYQKLGDLAKVDEAYQTIFKLRPAENSFRIDLANIYAKAGRLDDAEATLRNNVDGAPDNIDSKRLLVSFISDHRGLDAAETEIKAYIKAAPDNSQFYFWLADLYLKFHAVDRAEKLLQQIVDKDHFEPSGLNARTTLAQLSFNRGDRALAEKLLATVLDRDPANHIALYIRARMAVDRGQYEAAVADLRAILREDPREKDSLQLLAEALLRQGHIDLAINNQSLLVDLDLLNNAARVRLGQMYHLNQDSTRAMEALDIVTKAFPDYSVGWESTARIAIDLKDWATAQKAIGKLEQMEGQKLTSVFLQGEALAAQGKNEEAIRQFTQVIGVDPGTPLAEHALVSLVTAYRKVGRLEVAAHYIEVLKSDSPVVTTILGECYVELGKLDLAAKEFDQALETNTARPGPYLDRARLFITTDHNEQAIEVLKRGTTAVPNNTDIPLMLAGLLGASGRHQEAVALYDALLQGNPSLDVAANNLAELIADYQAGDGVALERARRAAERFQSTSNPLLLDTLGWVYFQLGKLDQALPVLARAAADPSVPPQVHYHYAAVLLGTGNKGAAKTQLEIATAGKIPYPGLDDANRLLQGL